MGSSGADAIPRGIEIGSSEANIEIKIKTLDSQTYTMIVDKQMPVPALKEQIASVTGVLSEQQRLICRGKVLKDDQLLSAYHVEDGHTLHLVVRQPVLPSPEGLTNNSATDPASGTSHGQMAPSFVIEAFTDQGEGVPPEISRFLSAILGSIGIPNFGIGSEGSDVARDHVPQRASTTGSAGDTAQLQPPQAGGRGQSHGLHSAFGLPAAISLGSLHSPPVISDSLTTLSQYLAHMKREFDAIVSGRGRENNAPTDTTRAVHIDTNATSESSTTQARLPTPASLAEMLLSSRQVLIEQVAECLHQVARQIESQADVTDSAARLSTQSSTWRTGVQLHNLGAFLLELGRTAMTLRLGQAPSDALVNAGPAVFINQSGPNPLMVQPLHFQSGTSFGSFHMGGGNPGAGLVNGIGSGFVPRRVDIQIRGSSAGAANNNPEEHVQTQQPAGQANPVSASGSDNHANLTGSRVAEGSPFVGESGVRVVPIRTVIAAVPRSFSRLPSDSSGNLMGLYNPLLARYQHGSAGLASGMRRSQGSGEHHSVGTRNEQHSTTEPTMQRPNVESRESDGSVPTPNLREEPSVSRTININILSSGGTQNNQESDTQIPSSVMQLLRGLFPGGEIHVEGANLQGTTTNPVPENAGPSTGSAEPEPRVTDEGIFLSTLLREIMPLITQSGGAEARVSSQSAESSSETECVDVGSSRRPSDTEPGPNSKRQKME